jgi:hypothetical protein
MADFSYAIVSFDTGEIILLIIDDDFSEIKKKNYSIILDIATYDCLEHHMIVFE